MHTRTRQSLSRWFEIKLCTRHMSSAEKSCRSGRQATTAPTKACHSSGANHAESTDPRFHK